MNDGTLIIWVNSPPYVELGAFAFVEEHWPGRVVYAVLGQLRPERQAMGWGQGGGGSSNARSRAGEPIDVFADRLVREFPNAMHLVGGLSHVTGAALRIVTTKVPKERIAVMTERPGVHGPLQKRIATRVGQPIKYRFLTRRYRDKVGLLLPLGEAAFERFARYGWPRRGMRSFMYCPPQTHGPSPLSDTRSGIKFLYVGRMSRYAKGTDLLLSAAERLHGTWSLTLVGGHGDFVETARRWASERNNVSYLGAADPDCVTELLATHHVCVVPSRVDGWNVVVNEALSAGRGVIATDTIGSDELVYTSGAGAVVPAKDVDALARRMQTVVNNPSLAVEWSERAKRYSPRIGPSAVGAYLLRVLQETMHSSEVAHDKGPWLGGGDREEK